MFYPFLGCITHQMPTGKHRIRINVYRATYDTGVVARTPKEGHKTVKATANTFRADMLLATCKQENVGSNPTRSTIYGWGYQK